jgi:hypothetical protein
MLLLVGLACAGRNDLVERDYPNDAFSVRGPEARIQLTHAAYLPRGVEFELRLTNVAVLPVEVERDGILLSYQGLEYPLDASAPATVWEDASIPAVPLPTTLALSPGEMRRLRLPFRLGRSMSEAGWIVVRGLRVAGEYREPLWLEVPAVPSKLELEPRSPKGRRAAGGT